VSVLQRRGLHPNMVSNQEMAAAGGLWLVERSADRAAAVAEARERGVRALEVVGDLSFLAELPELEFLIAMDPPDAAPIHELKRLRQLSFSGTWGGRLDGSAWPALERFHAVEIPKDGGGVEMLFDHPHVRELALQRPQLADLRPIAAPRLASFVVGQTRSLASLTGVEARASTLLDLTLWGLPELESLRGLESLGRLEVLHLESLRKITSLETVARLPGVRFLDIFDLKGVESLRPLAGHPTLEYIGFGRTVDLDLEPLFTIPNLKLVLTGPSYRWNRDVHDLPYLHDVGRDDPRRLEWNRLTVR
jgi:hypothetical protein